jgi:hypothetical protein
MADAALIALRGMVLRQVAREAGGQGREPSGPSGLTAPTD